MQKKAVHGSDSMRRRLVRAIIGCTLAVLLVLLIPLMERYILPKKQVSTQQISSENIDILRNEYYFRNFIWSGIFPLYGGFISDPHFLFQLPQDLTQYLSPVFQTKLVRYQLIQVNPYFKNRTSEMVLAMEIDGETYEYKLEVPSDYPSFVTESEPRGEFLYHDINLYYVLSYGWENKFLIYEILPPFNENKVLSNSLVSLGQSHFPEYLKFSIAKDQADRFISHSYSGMYDFYTKYLNTEYINEQLNATRGEELRLSLLYGANLNLTPALFKKLREQGDELFKLQLKSNYEFITSVQPVTITHAPSENKIIIKVDHWNYNDVLVAGETFMDSSFTFSQETKYILIQTEDTKRIISNIDKYIDRRGEGSKEIEYLVDHIEGTYKRIPFLMEMVTKNEHTQSNQRLGMSFVVLPPNTSQQSLGNYSNRNTYEIPDIEYQNEYLFVMDFQDFSLKLTFEDAQEFANFLRRNLEIKN